MTAITSVSPSVYRIWHGLQSVNGAESQVNDVKGWWSQVFAADRAKASYIKASGNSDEGLRPPSIEAVTHFGFRWAGLELAKELTRQAQAADCWRQHHLAEAIRLRAEAQQLRAQAASLRAQAAAASDEDVAAALAAEAAQLEARAAELETQALKHDEWAALALAWYDAASFAARGGEDLVGLYDRKFADLNAAVAAARGDRAEDKEYAA
jgi:hypothetical protein